MRLMVIAWRVYFVFARAGQWQTMGVVHTVSGQTVFVEEIVSVMENSVSACENEACGRTMCRQFDEIV